MHILEQLGNHCASGNCSKTCTGTESSQKTQAGMHKMIALSPCARIQSRQGHVAVVGRLSVTILNTHSKMSISGDVTEKGKSKDFVTREGHRERIP